MSRTESLSNISRRNFLGFLFSSALFLAITPSCEAESQIKPAENSQLIVGGSPINGDSQGIRYEKRNINHKTEEFKIIE